MKKRVCVFCSSGERLPQEYYEMAEHFGSLLGKIGFDLVYGGTDVGLMKAVAYGARQNGAKIIGIIPDVIEQMGIASKNCDELIVCHSMAERKVLLDKKSDAFVVLPGGFGTLDELSEVLVAKQLNFHCKPLILLNHNDFFRGLLTWFERCYSEKFSQEKYRQYYAIAESPETALQILKTA